VADLFTLPHHLDSKARTVRAIVETPPGHRSKFNYSPDSGLFELHDILPAGMSFPMAFGTGIAVGEIRVFRSALYGRPANHAAWMSGRMSAGGLLCPAELTVGLPAEIQARIVVEPAPPELRNVITRRSFDPASGPAGAIGDTISDDLVFVVPRT